MSDDITVITITRGRPLLLKRAIASVRSQDYAGQITHLVIVDDCAETAGALAGFEGAARRALVSRFESREPGEVSGQARLARLRNLAVRITDSRWVAFLDDDNEYEPNHLSSLFALASRNKHPAVHSYRTLHQPDGSPYLEERFPWVRDHEEGRRFFEFLCARGVLRRGSNVMRDRADPKGQPDGIRMVDTSVWLLERSLLIRHPFPQQYTEGDVLNNVYEDDKLLDLLVEHEVPISTTGLATLRYYLGGYSNPASP